MGCYEIFSKQKQEKRGVDRLRLNYSLRIIKTVCCTKYNKIKEEAANTER